LNTARSPTAPAAGPGPTLVYIAGSGRCGSTLLDILLGAHPEIQSTGELMRLLGGAEGGAQTCACGLDIRICPFWSVVERELGGPAALGELAKGKRLEGTKGLFVGRLGGPKSGRLARRHAARLEHLVRVVSRVSGRRFVVDSSKSLGRGYLYRGAVADGVDVRYIHVVRDGRAFLWSKRARPDGEGVGKRTPDRSPLRLAGLWTLTNFLASVVFSAQSGRYLRVRYEDLTARPQETVERIGRFLGLEMGPVLALLEPGRAIPISHVVGGNRLRFTRGLTIRPDTEWEQSLPPKEKAAFWAVAGWLARWYGYAPSRRTPVAAARAE
jgi:Sulfotransferase family